MNPPYEITWKDRKYVRASAEPRFTRRVLHDWERTDWKGYVDRPNLPEVFRCGELDSSDNHHFVKLDRAWQFFWFNIMSKVYFGKYSWQLTRVQYAWLGSRWTAVGSNHRAFTNEHGLDKFRNYVTNTNMDMNSDPAIATIVCGGHCFREIRIVTNRFGEEMLEVPSFDGRAAPPDVTTIDVKNDPRIFIANNITSTKVSSGGYSVTPFPQLQRDGGPTDVPVILVSYGPIYFPVKYTELIGTQIKVNPYNAPRDIFLKYP